MFVAEKRFGAALEINPQHVEASESLLALQTNRERLNETVRKEEEKENAEAAEIAEQSTAVNGLSLTFTRLHHRTDPPPGLRWRRPGCCLRPDRRRDIRRNL